MQTEDMITRLSQALAPVRRLPSPATLTLLWLGIATLVVGGAVAFLGLRHELDERTAAGQDVRQMAAAALTGVLAVLAAFQLSFPDRDRRWALLPLPALALWLGDLGWGCLQGFARLGAEGLRLTTIFPCLAFILGFGLRADADASPGRGGDGAGLARTGDRRDDRHGRVAGAESDARGRGVMPA